MTSIFANRRRVKKKKNPLATYLVTMAAVEDDAAAARMNLSKQLWDIIHEPNQAISQDKNDTVPGSEIFGAARETFRGSAGAYRDEKK
jgi:hypothetical protein